MLETQSIASLTLSMDIVLFGWYYQQLFAGRFFIPCLCNTLAFSTSNGIVIQVSLAINNGGSSGGY
jgi:hypothetical protein